MFSEYLKFFSTKKASEWDLSAFADHFDDRQTFEKVLYWCLDYISNSDDWNGEKGDKARSLLKTLVSNCVNTPISPFHKLVCLTPCNSLASKYFDKLACMVGQRSRCCAEVGWKARTR